MTRAGTQTLAARLATRPDAPDDLVLDVVAQVGFALQALHEDGRVYGNVTADHVLLNDDDSIALLARPTAGPASSGGGTPADDLAALGRLSRDLLGPQTAPATRRFVEHLAEPARDEPVDAGDVARTALALRAGTLHHRQPPAATQTSEPAADPVADLSRRQVRNRLIAIGAAVVLVGVALLVVLGRHTGQTIPDVQGDSYAAATSTLHAKGFGTAERLVAPHGDQPADRVVSQSPGAGNRVHAGSTITLVVTR